MPRTRRPQLAGETPHAAVYLRVSSKSQQLASQEPDLNRWAAACDGPVAFYTDNQSGTTMDRPGWERLWEQARRGLVTRIVVWRLDRLGRTASGLTRLFEDLRGIGVGLVSLREGIDLDTPAGRLMAHVLASVAQYETEVRGERQAAGIAQARARGVRFGPKPGTGGRPPKVTTEKRQLILRLYQEGAYVASIARMTALSRTTVYSVVDALESPEVG